MIKLLVSLIMNILCFITKSFFYVPLGICAFFNKSFIKGRHFSLLFVSFVIALLTILWGIDSSSISIAVLFLFTLPLYMRLVGKEYEGFKENSKDKGIFITEIKECKENKTTKYIPNVEFINSLEVNKIENKF